MNSFITNTKSLGKRGLLAATSLFAATAMLIAPALAADSSNPFNTNTAGEGGIKSNLHVAQGGTLTDTVVALVNNIFLLVGFLAVLFIIYAGIRLIVSRGNEEAMKNATKTLTYAVVGFMLILFSYIIVRFIVEILLSSNAGSETGEFDPTATPAAAGE